MKGIVGRPQKYAVVLRSLPDFDLFTPAKIASRASSLGLIGPGTEEEPIKLLLQRIRISLGRFSNNHGFPDDGDGFVRVFGQSPTAGWFGWRWKASAQALNDRELKRLAAALAHLPESERIRLLDQVKRK